MNTVNQINVLDSISVLPKYTDIHSQQATSSNIDKIENRLCGMFHYFDKFYTHLLSFKLEEEGTSYPEHIKNFDNATRLIEGINASDIAFIRDGNRPYSMQLSLFGNYLFQRLWMRYKYHEEDLDCFDTAYEEAHRLCKAELKTYEPHYINKNYENFFNLARRIMLGNVPSNQTFLPGQDESVTSSSIVNESAINIQRKANEYHLYMYEKATRQFQKLGLDTSTLTVGFSMLLNAGADFKPLNLWIETFTHLESKGLETGYYTGAFVELIQTPGITFNDLKLFACSAVALIENEMSIDELTDDVIKSLKRDDVPTREQESWIREHCSQAGMQAGGVYQTRRDRIKKNVIIAIGTTIVKIPFIILKLFV